jgi:hypothetical protein
MDTNKSIAEIWWKRKPIEEKWELKNKYHPAVPYLFPTEIECIWEDEGKPAPRELTWDEMKDIAYTNTYNLDINPEAVPDLLKSLKEIIELPFFQKQFGGGSIDTRAKITIEKAKTII